ncbi:acyl-CoA dehydrogenase [Nocardioides sp. Root1257]|uniref:acyl-CoA dehydrogenase family protein n=1 Tax=unclassified Nocardioides TaxID=2615069 RepID=UPI0006F40B69|nr:MULTISPECIES: acyl-CoA dehydrogenase family protein [unclassified Nocardioides]KQW47398.1 acyl-CoA dehydrogenase [Nocardioides sp. Root1257]KRC45554.1 acyl-CoA dehydrogenase [Nocardioides sp. Root224]
MTLAEKARAAAPVLAASDAESGARGRLTEEAWQALQSTGVLRALQPARWGGGETSVVEYADAIIEIGRHSASAGWVASVVGVHPWQIALFPEETQAELWGDTPDRAIASSYTPTGRIEKVDGGYRVSGRWSFSSGIEWCDGVLLGGIAGTREINGTEHPDFTAVILDRADYRVERTWDVAGLRGTGSNDVVVDEVFVPERRGQSHLFYTHGLGTPLPGQELNDGALYRVPWAGLFNLIIAAGAIGAAQGFMDCWVAETRTRRTNYGQMLREEGVVQRHLADAEWLLDAARLKVRRTAVELMEYAEARQVPSREQRAYYRWDVAKAANAATDAAQELMRVSSGRSAFLDHPLQAKYQDVVSASSHAFLYADPLARAWAGRHLGSDNPVEVHL